MNFFGDFLTLCVREGTSVPHLSIFSSLFYTIVLCYGNGTLFHKLINFLILTMSQMMGGLWLVSTLYYSSKLKTDK